MNVYRLHKFDDYVKHATKNQQAFLKRQALEKSLAEVDSRVFSYPGISYPANKLVDFEVDYQYSDGVNINWRERLVCPVTNLNNRLRCCIHLIDSELGIYPDDKVYITEAVTSMFNLLSGRHKNIVGSEYLGIDVAPGKVVDGVRHEDMTALSFADQTFDHYLSFECFEHVPFFGTAVKEVFRVLKPGGTFFGSFPFDLNSETNIIRAYIDETGETVHLMEPDYHGDPVSEKGILCYTVFGWEFLEQFRQCGFKDVYLMLVWSDVYGYLGGEQVFFVAKK